MKKNIILLMFLIETTCLFAQAQRYAHISGQFQQPVTGNVYFIKLDAGKLLKDSILVIKDGKFEIKTIVQEPCRAYITCEFNRTSIPLFVENGMDAELKISFTQKNLGGEMMNMPVVDYKGDNADCYKFLDRLVYWQFNPISFQEIDTLDFAKYRELTLEDFDSLKANLIKIKSTAFKKMMEPAFSDKVINGKLFRFAWSKPRQDKIFSQWVETFDRNDPNNMELAMDYLRWYTMNNPAKNRENPSVSYLNDLNTIFTNHDIINTISSDYMANYLKSAPSDMDETWTAYNNICTDKDAIEKLKPSYEHYSKLKQGTKAIDFDMTSVEGKKTYLSNFKGKFVYVDIWATWCSPCCHEIPFMAKLVEHYKDNDQIQFISISLDTDKASWEKKLKEDSPRWKQFICSSNDSILVKSYNVTGIPRFMFFDKKGNIISLDAPRPSSGDITKFIDRYIQQ